MLERDVNRIFSEKLWELTYKDINNLHTIVYWLFKSVSTPDQKYFFIKNSIFTSNYRERINGKLTFGGLYQYLEEVDTTIPIEHNADGVLTSESWNKIFEFRKELSKLYTNEF